MKKKHVIWSNDTDALRAVVDDVLESAELSEMEAYSLAGQILADYLDDERANLNIETRGEIVCIADLGLWNGRFTAYRLMGKNVKNCLRVDYDEAEFYVDAFGNLRGTESHHDGTNHYLFREFKETLSDVSRDNFLEKIRNGSVTKGDIARCTKALGHKAAKVYGW